MRYQVFLDDIELVRGSEAWKRMYPGLSLVGAYNDVARRIRGLRELPEEERGQYIPEICRELDENVYVPTLRSIDADHRQAYTWRWDDVPWGDYPYNLRYLLVNQSCADYTPYEPYPESPGLRCSDFEYQDDAEEYVWTYWYADDAQSLRSRNDRLGRACIHLPSRR